MQTQHPSAIHKFTVVFLHGRDSTVAEFMPEFFESQASDDRTLPEIFPQVKWVFPNSGIISSARFGVDMSQWFDMWSTEDPHEREHEQAADRDRAVSNLLHIIEDEAALVGGKKNIILAGISQGCASAIHALMRQESQIGGFIGLSSWLPAKEALAKPTTSALNTPVFLSHSADDEVIAIRYGEDLRDSLALRGMDVEWHRYEDGGHWVNEPQGIDDMSCSCNERWP